MSYVPMALRPLSSYQRDEMDDIKRRLEKQEVKEIPNPTAILAVGDILIGATPPQLTGALGTGQLQVSDTASNTLLLTRDVADANGPTLEFLKRRTAWGVVSNGDALGTIAFSGADGADAALGAKIVAEVDAAPGNDDIPTRLVFSVSPDASATPVEALRINRLGYVRLGGGGDAASPLHIPATVYNNIQLGSTYYLGFRDDDPDQPYVRFNTNNYIWSILSEGRYTFIASGSVKMNIGPEGVLYYGTMNASTSLGYSNVRLGVDSTTPRIIFDQSSQLWTIDLSSDTLRFYKPGSVKVVMYNTGLLEAFGGLKASAVSSGGVLQLGGGDNASGSNNYTQIRFGYNTTTTFPQWIRSRHGVTAPANALDFYTCDGTSGGVFPTNAVHGLTVQGGKIGLGSVIDPTFPIHMTADPINSSPFYGQIVVQPSSDSSDAFINLKTTRGSDRVWGIGAGSGTPNDYFRIRDFTAGADRLNITDQGRLLFTGGIVADVNLSFSSLAAGSLSIGNTSVDYTPTAGNWNTSGSTLILSGATYTNIGFHDSGNRVDYIRAGGGVISIGYNGSWGSAYTELLGGARVERGGNGNGALVIFGTTYSSHFSYSTDEHTYIRGGKATSAVIIGDVNSGGIGIGAGGGTVQLGAGGGPVLASANLGIKVTPQQLIHGYNNGGGFAFVTGAFNDGTAVTWIADGSGDVTERLHPSVMVWSTDGGSVSNPGGMSNLVPGGSLTITHGTSGSKIVIAVSAGGAVTCQRTVAGSDWRVVGFLIWR